MNNFPYILAMVVLINLAVAGVVLLTNPVRMQNRTFFAFAFLLSLWAVCVQIVATTADSGTAELFIRLSEYFGLLLPAAFQALCVSMVSGQQGLGHVFRQVRWNLLLSQVFGIVAFTPLFMTGVTMNPDPGEVPSPIYGPAFPIVQLYIVLAFVLVIGHFVRKRKELDGIERAELQFTLLGVTCGVVVVTITSLVLQLLVPSINPQQYGPLCIIPINLIIAYGVATHRILNVSAFLQRATAYLVLGVYLLGLYIGVHWLTSLVVAQFGQPSDSFSHLVAALAVAFSVSPVRGFAQQLSHKLFINRDTLTVAAVTRQGNAIFASISTTDAILKRFFDILDEGGIDALHRTVLLPSREGFEAWADPSAAKPDANPLRLHTKSALVRALQDRQAPIAVDTLRRVRPTPSSRSTLRALGRLDMDLAVGMYFKGTLRGMVMLGPRRSGRIYSSSEQDALRVLCDQLAVALENANLYTEVQDNKIYNDILVDSLLSGVIAASAEGYISVFNREAQRMTGLGADATLGRAVEVLPGELARILRDTLRTGQPVRDRETVIAVNGRDDVPIRCGSSLFHGSRGNLLGAIVVFSDQTAQKRLEMQVRRSDRLASIGTLSAGMAHEIKNPLVTVKTFTELLPERYTDEDFRDTFSTLVSKEVQRIDTIVNQLLRFARPAKADLKPIALKDVIESSLGLLQEQLRKNQVTPEYRFEAEEDLVKADASLLEQAFVNLTFNAIDAMPDGGTLTLSTLTTQPPWHLRQQNHASADEVYIRVSIQDTGCGIDPGALERVFDPFYTTKEHGTGLGLSISHGIIAEHDGLIDVESRAGVGTTFHIYIPLLHREAAVP